MTTNPNTRNILLQLLRMALNEGYMPTLPSAIDWEAVRNLADRQGVGAIVWASVAKLEATGAIAPDTFSTATKLQWAYSVERQVKKYRKQEAVITKLAKILEADNIRLMTLKGYGLSLNYPTPEHRSCSDIDIWLFGEHNKANDIISKRLGIEIDSSRHHHTVFYVDGVMVENHYHLLDLSAHSSNRDIERELHDVIEHGATAITIGSTEIWQPSANGHALFMLRHAASHFAAVEIVLRHIVDWGLFLRHHHNEVDWQWLRSICQRHNMEQFLDVITIMASDICALDISLVPNITHRPELEERILDDILSAGCRGKLPRQGLLRIVAFKMRRWWRNRWKHKLVYRESLVCTFLTQVIAHIRKPQSIKK